MELLVDLSTRVGNGTALVVRELEDAGDELLQGRRQAGGALYRIRLTRSVDGDQYMPVPGGSRPRDLRRRHRGRSR